MKKIFLIILIALLLLGSTAVSSFAYTFGYETFSESPAGPYTYGYSNQGTYLGTAYNANDDIATLTEFFIWRGITVNSLSFYGKNEDGVMTGDPLYIPEFETDDEGQYRSGTWQTFKPGEDQPAEPNLIDFIIVKGGTSFSVHQYDPSAFSGEWNIGYLDENGSGFPPTLSHLSGYIAAPVPEPATMMLFGIGLLGIAGVARRKA